MITIYCEGESEVQYFNMLRQKYKKGSVHADKIKFKKINANGLSILERAYIQERNNRRKSDEVYVAFDRDKMNDNEVAKCVNYAEKIGYKLLFSSISFEVWILMHFEEVNRHYTNEQLKRKLSGKDYFNTDYNKFKGNNYDDFLYDRVADAKNNGDKLLKSNNDIIKDNPYTNISREIGKIFRTEVF